MRGSSPFRNKGAIPHAFDATIECQEQDGFIIDTSDSGAIVVKPNTEDTATGYALISMPGARNVARTVATRRSREALSQVHQNQKGLDQRP